MRRPTGYAIIVVFLAGICVTGASYALTVRAIHRANAAYATAIQLCQAGNDARAQQTGLWDYIVRLSPPPKTARERAVLAKFEHHLHTVFAPRNCHALTRR